MLNYTQVDDLTFNAMLSVLQGGMRMLNDFERFLAPYKLSQGRFALMLTVYNAGGNPLSPSQLAEESGKSRPTVSKMIDRLIQDRLIAPEKAAGDGRSRVLYLTEEGEALLNLIIPEYNKRIQEMSSPLDDDEKMELIRIIGKIAI